MALPYPTIRETRRIRRWFETGGAAHRLVVAVAATAADRDTVTAGIIAGGSMRHIALDVSEGPLVPDGFRDYRGTHTSYTLFTFAGVGERLRRDGAEAIAELERSEAMFRRNATWALVWLDDPVQATILARHAPRFWAAVELHPTLSGPALVDARERAALEPLIAAAAAGRRSLAPEAAASLLIERGDVAGLRRLIDEADLTIGSYLLLRGRGERMTGDAQAALATLAAAAATDGPHRGEAFAHVAETLARLGDRDGAAATARMARDHGASGPAALVAALAEVASGAVNVDPSLADLRKRLVGEPETARALARHLASAHPDDAIAVLREASVEADGDPVLQTAIALDLALLLTAQGSADEAEEVLGSLPAPTTELRLARARARLAIARSAAGEPATAEAERLLEQAAAAARSAPREQIEVLWERAALASLAGDLGRVAALLTELETTALRVELREEAFTALERRAEALRLDRQLAAAAAAIDELESVALDLTWPDLERRALIARAEHLHDVGAHRDGARALREAAGIADATGDAEAARALERRADALLSERPDRDSPS